MILAWYEIQSNCSCHSKWTCVEKSRAVLPLWTENDGRLFLLLIRSAEGSNSTKRGSLYFFIFFCWTCSKHEPYLYVNVGFRLCNVNCMRLPCIPNYPIHYLIVLRWNHNTVQLKIQLLWENVCFVNIQLKTQSNFVILQLPTSFWSSFVWASKCWDRIGGVRRYSFFIPWCIDFINQRCHICLSSSD